MKSKKVWHKGVQFSAEVAPFVSRMSLVDDHRESLLRLQGVWDSLALLGQMSGAAADMGGTRSAFQALSGTLLDSLARRLLDNCVSRLRGKAQVAIDILVRNLFERTADVGFLAADGPLREHVALCADPQATPEQQAASRAALEARFRAYVAKYSVYDDIVVLSPQGRVLARLDRSVADAAPCSDPLIAAALRPGTPFVESHGALEVLGGRTSLVYASAVGSASGAGGVLCLSFRLADEMRGVFRQLLRQQETGDRTVLVLRDKEGRVLQSSDRWQIPLGAELPPVDRNHRLVFAGRDYLAVATEASGYEGYCGPGWSALALLPVEHAFDTAVHEDDELQQDFAALAAGLDTRELFDAELRGIPLEAARIQRDLQRSLWNGKLRSRLQPDGNGEFAVTLLNEVERTGQQLRQVFEQAIGNLQNSALAAVFDEVLFHARLAIDIMDRNLYERANDVRWWALDASLQQALLKASQGDAAAAQREAELVLRRINGLYTVYSLLLVFDRTGRVVAVSDPAQAPHHLGRQLDETWVAEALALRDRERYVVSPHEASGLYAGRPSYVYATSLPAPGDANAVVGGLAIVFDGEAQFAAMLGDALPQRSGAAGLFVTRSGRIVSSSDEGRWPIGATGPLSTELLSKLAAGESRSVELAIDGVVHAAGLSLSAGYREYRCGAAPAAEDVIAVVLQALGPRLPASAQDDDASGFLAPQAQVKGGKHIDIASFSVAGRALGLPADAVLEALMAPRLVALPNAPGALVGMIEHRDRMLPVIDIGLLLGEPACGADSLALVCRTPSDQVMALRVQALGQVFSVAPEQIHPSPTRTGAAGPTRLVRGSGAGMLSLLDVESLWAGTAAAAPLLDQEDEAGVLLLPQ